MNRKISLIVVLVLYILVGVAGLFYVIANGTVKKPEKSTLTPSQVSVSKLDAPDENAIEGPSFDDLDNYEDFFSDTSSDDEESFIEEIAAAEDLFSDSSDEDSLSSEEQSYTFVAIHDRGRLFIRDMPSMDGNIIGHMYRGQKGDVIKDGDGWIYARYKDVTGYISKEYVELIPVEETSEETE